MQFPWMSNKQTTCKRFDIACCILYMQSCKSRQEIIFKLLGGRCGYLWNEVINDSYLKSDKRFELKEIKKVNVN